MIFISVLTKTTKKKKKKNKKSTLYQSAFQVRHQTTHIFEVWVRHVVVKLNANGTFSRTYVIASEGMQ